LHAREKTSDAKPPRFSAPSAVRNAIATLRRVAEYARLAPRFSALRHRDGRQIFKKANLRGRMSAMMSFQGQNDSVMVRR
jgi:hypothetical protein